jgi:hypothetical protein
MNKQERYHDEFPDPDTIKEMLDVISDKIPELLKELSAVLYSPAQAKQFGVSAATFYKELKAAGMSDEQAFSLTNQYMSTMSLGSAVKGLAHDHGYDDCYSQGQGHGHGWKGFKELKKLKEMDREKN